MNNPALEKELCIFHNELEKDIIQKQDDYSDKLSLQLKEARILLRNHPFLSLFNINPESYLYYKKDWHNFLGTKLEQMIGIILEPYLIKPIPKEFVLSNNRQICDFVVQFGDNFYAIENKIRYNTAERMVRIKHSENFLKIKSIYNGKFIPIFLILLEDNNVKALNEWRNIGWQIYQGNAMNDFLKEKTNFDLFSYWTKLKNENAKKLCIENLKL